MGSLLRLDRNQFNLLAGIKVSTALVIMLLLTHFTGESWLTTTIAAMCAWLANVPGPLLHRIGGNNIAEVNRLPISRVLTFFLDMAATFEPDPASKLVFREIVGRLTYLSEVGLGYLSLDRQSRSLSGGEVQRVHLTRALGSPLVNTLYVLDEPSVGLHPRDNRRLVRILRALTRQRNTVVVVEHDPEIIRASDYLVDLGPGAGERGGRAVFAGPSSEISSAKSSRTGAYITGSSRPAPPTKRRRPRKNHRLDLVGIQAHNLRTLVEMLHTVPAESLAFHGERNHFSTWLKARTHR